MRFWLVLLLIPFFSYSQEDVYRDSLEQIIAAKNSKAEVKEALFLLGEHLEFKEPELGEQIANQLLEEHIKPKDSADIMRVNFILAASNRWRGNYTTALDYYFINHGYFSRKKDSMNMAKAGHYIGTLSGFTGKNIRSQKFLLEVAEVYKKYGSPRQRASINSSLAGHYFDMEQYEKAAEKYLETLAFYKEENDTSGLAAMHGNLGYLYTEMGEYEKAEMHLLEDRKFNDYFPTKREAGFNYDFMGYLYQKQGRKQEAYQEYIQALEIRKEAASTYNLCESLNSVGSILVDLERYDEAIPYLNQVFTYEDHESAYQEQTAHEFLSQAYEGKGDYKNALVHYKSFTEIVDSVASKEKFDILAEKDAAYKKQEQDAEIALLNKKKEVSDAKLNQSRTMLIASLLGLLLLGGFAFYAVRANQKIKAKNEVIRKALEEKELLMREIHHRVKNNLQTISSLLNLQSRYIKDEHALEAIQKGRNRVQSMAILHKSLYSEDDLTSVDMQQYFANLAKSIFNSYKLREDQIKLNIEANDIKLDIDSVIPIGLIINELITNSLKHAFTESKELHAEIGVKLRESSDAYELIVSDNGKGVSDEILAREQEESFGQRMIRAFAQKLRATINVNNQNGTEVCISIPKMG